MSCAIFIRSYRNDFEWLNYCLKSIDKYCSGFNEIIIVVPHEDLGILRGSIFTKYTVHHVHERTTGYIDQQITKLQAHHYTQSDQILFVDSDCCFFKPCTPESFKQNGLPILLKTPYSVFRKQQQETGVKQQVLHWQPITEKAVGFPVKYEYMRRIPMMFNRFTLQFIESMYPQLPNYCCDVPSKEFSEFNFIGAIVDKYQAELYTILDTTINTPPEKVAEQRWSWGGLTPEIRKELEEACS